MPPIPQIPRLGYSRNPMTSDNPLSPVLGVDMEVYLTAVNRLITKY